MKLSRIHPDERMFGLALLPFRKESCDHVESEEGESPEKRSRRKGSRITGQPKNFYGRHEL